MNGATIRISPVYAYGSVSFRRDGAGKIEEYSHSLPPGVRGNRYASQSFCRFKLPGAPSHAGVYVITTDNELKCIGECDSLEDRFGPGGYGHIAVRNCHHDGQSTNCKINSLILKSVKAGGRIDVWFHKTSRRNAIEAELLDLLKPSWNGNRGGEASRTPAPREQRRGHVPTADDFRLALRGKLRMAHKAGQDSLRVRSGDLHREVGGYPGPNHRMPSCCQVMRGEMHNGDKVIDEPPRGAGANLVIEYRIPRP